MKNQLIATSTYLSGREALVVEVDMSNYLIDYYLYRKEVAPATDPAHDEKLKDLLACLAIHLTVRPSAEAHAWTAHLVATPPYSLFAAGELFQLEDARKAEGYLIGNILTENIRYTDVNSLHAQKAAGGTQFRSYVQSESSDIHQITEQFYRQSEQLPLRIYLSRTSDRALGLAALPQFDEEWFHQVGLEDFKTESSGVHMRTCTFDFSCDCTPDKLMPFFSSLSNKEINDLYGDDKEIIIACPRCGRQFAIERNKLPNS